MNESMNSCLENQKFVFDFHYVKANFNQTPKNRDSCRENQNGKFLYEVPSKPRVTDPKNHSNIKKRRTRGILQQNPELRSCTTEFHFYSLKRLNLLKLLTKRVIFFT